MAILLTQSDAAFLHVPKTGGHWIESALSGLGIPWVRAPVVRGVSIRHALRRHLTRGAAFHFTFVRDPHTWYESWWKYQAGRWQVFEPGAWHPQRALESCADDGFNRFIENCLHREPAYVTRMYEWYAGPPGDACADFIGRYERLPEDLAEVLTRLGHDVSLKQLQRLPRRNVSECRRGPPRWDPALKEAVANAESAAIRRFYGEDVIGS